ncbi:hypothetical protein EV182_001659 [Spiromyces aspiralis]|uniref:Uncharacterized protein n=1 Tax=Spiromyces aspiralis TaxID=68401 RepID=A0ACC1HIN7_9FUNG|nr:hypothetical protein EV182_001659 [Spiromyces aspiralis]
MAARGLSVLGFIIEHGDHRIRTFNISSTATPTPEGETARTFVVKAFKDSNSAIAAQGVRQVHPVAKIVDRMSWLYRGVVPGEGWDIYVKFDAQYSSIRMLRGYGGWAVIDDTESLSYVMSYAVAYAYGDESIQGLFWLEHVPDFAKLRTSLLNSLEIFSRILFWDSRLDDEGTVKVLEDLYSILFGRVNPLALYAMRKTMIRGRATMVR